MAWNYQRATRLPECKDCPDPYAHVFHMKLHETTCFIQVEEIFDNLYPYVHDIEFRKWGLSHAFCINVLSRKPEKKLNGPEFKSTSISTETPSEKIEHFM